MSFDPERHHRRSVRLPGFDYTRGWFFVTICTENRSPLLGEIDDERMSQSAFGHLAEVFWTDIPSHFPGTTMDAFVIMPNHLHGIIVLERPDEHSDPPVESFRKPVQGSLATIIRSFKSAATKSINIVRESPGAPIWQKGFYERAIRSEQELVRIRQYIEANPSKWNDD